LPTIDHFPALLLEHRSWHFVCSCSRAIWRNPREIVESRHSLVAYFRWRYFLRFQWNDRANKLPFCAN